MGVEKLHQNFTSTVVLSFEEFQAKVLAPAAVGKSKTLKTIKLHIDASIQAYQCLEACRDDMLSFYGEASGDVQGQFVDVFVRRYVVVIVIREYFLSFCDCSFVC